MGRWFSLALVLFVAPAASGVASAQDVPMPAFHAGDQVDVQYGATWYAATVLAVPQPGQWEISYDGYGASWNEVVGPPRIRPRSPAPPPPPPAAPPGRGIPHLLRVGTNTRVLVEWHGTWYAARILRVVDDAHAHIRYVGYDRSSDEDVDLGRLRMPDKR